MDNWAGDIDIGKGETTEQLRVTRAELKEAAYTGFKREDHGRDSSRSSKKTSVRVEFKEGRW